METKGLMVENWAYFWKRAVSHVSQSLSPNTRNAPFLISSVDL